MFQVTVTDSGVGVKCEGLPKMFRPFSQIQNGLPAHHEGTGLGLAITKRLVDAMGGEIWVQNEWVKGSRFGFTLSAAESA